MNLSESFFELLASRGTRTQGATAEELATLEALYPHLPLEIRSLLFIQNGEPFAFEAVDGKRFCGTEEIAENIVMLREMVESDETLPSCFLEFVPFLHTDVKTDVGVFTNLSIVFPAVVAELDYESGELILWADSVEEFLSRLLSRQPPINELGNFFPAQGMPTTSIHTMPGWPVD